VRHLILQLLDAIVELLAEGHAVELVQDGLVEALTDAVGLRALCLCPTVIDILDRQVELVLVAFGVAAAGALIVAAALAREWVLSKRLEAEMAARPA
jgi:hypothetical protein